MAKTQVLLKIIVNLKGFFLQEFITIHFSLVSGVYKPMECTEEVWYGSEATPEKGFVQRRLLMGLRNIFMDMFNIGAWQSLRMKGLKPRMK